MDPPITAVPWHHVCPAGGQGMEGVEVTCTEAELRPGLCQGVQVSQHSTMGAVGPSCTSPGTAMPPPHPWAVPALHARPPPGSARGRVPRDHSSAGSRCRAGAGLGSFRPGRNREK